MEHDDDGDGDDDDGLLLSSFARLPVLTALGRV